MGKNKKKTIAIFINTSWNIFNFRLHLLQRLQSEGYRIVAIAPKDSYSKKIKKAGFEYHHIDINNMGTNPLEDLRLTRAIYRLYRQIQPDLALHYTIKPNIYGNVAAKLAGVPVISNITGLGTVFLNDAFAFRLAQRLYRIGLRIPKKVFFQNPYDLDYFVSNKKLVAADKSELLPGSGIDPQSFTPLKRNCKRGRPFVFLLIARMLKDKGIVEFVEAACSILKRKENGLDDLHSDVEFWLVGSLYPGNPTAINAEEIDAWTEKGSIIYLGHTDDVKRVIARSDCVVLPSYREGLARVLLEAASMGKPIIATDVPGCKDIVDNGVNGFLCEPRNAQCLAVQMEKMLSLSEGEREEMGRAGRKKVIEEYSESFVIDKYLDAIGEILGK